MAFLLKEGSLNNNKKPNNNVQRQQQRPRSREDEIYADLMAESEPKPQDQGIISNLTTGVARGAKSGLGGILGGLGYASQAETGVGGDFANVMNKLAEENARRKQYGWADMIPFANDYYTSPEGASYDVGQVVGSMAVPMALGAGTAATLGTGGAALPVVGAGLGGLVMAASEGGNTYKDALEQGYSEEEARSAGRTDAAIKAPFYMLSEGLTGAAGKALLSRAGKEAVKEGLGRTILKKGGTLLGEGLNEGLEEVFENKSSNYALNRDPNKSLVGDVIGGTANPYTWNDEDQEAFRSAFMGSLLTGGIGAGAAKAYHTAVGENAETKAKPKSAPEKVETPAQADDVLDTAEKIDERLEEIDGKIEAAAVSGNTREIARLGRERQELIEARENVLPEDLESLEKLQSKVDDEIEKVSNDIESAVVDLGEAKNKRKAAEKLQSLYEQRGKLAERSEQIANKIEMARASKPTPQRTNTPQPTPGVNYGENLGERMQVAEATDVGRAQRVDPQDVANGIGRAQGADYGALMGEDVAPTQPWQGYNTNPKPQPTPKPTGPSYAEQQRQQAEQQRLQAEQTQRDTGWYQMEAEYAQRKAMEAAKQKGFSENIGEWKAATMKPGESATVQDYVNSTGETLRIAKNDKNGLLKVSKGNEETYFTSLADAEEFVKSGKSPYDKLNARERAEKATEIRAAMAGKDAVNRALDRLKEKFTKAKTEQEVNQITGEAISDSNRILKESDIGKAMAEAKKRIKEELRAKGAKQAREKGFAAKLGDWYAVYDENASEGEQEYVNEKGAKIQIAIDESGPVSVIKSKGGSYWFTNLADANEFVKTGKNPYDKLTKEERIEKEVEIRAALAGKEAVEKALSDLKDKYDKAKTTADVANITAEAYRDPNRILKLSQIGDLQREAKNRIEEEIRRKQEEERKRKEEEERKRKEEQEAIIKDFESKIDGFINDFLNSVKQGDTVVDINKKLKSYKGKAVALHTKIKKGSKLTEAQVSDIRAKYMDKFADAKDKALDKAKSGNMFVPPKNPKKPKGPKTGYEPQELYVKFGVKGQGLRKISLNPKPDLEKVKSLGNFYEQDGLLAGKELFIKNYDGKDRRQLDTALFDSGKSISRIEDARKRFAQAEDDIKFARGKVVELFEYASIDKKGNDEYAYFQSIKGMQYRCDVDGVKYFKEKFGDDVKFYQSDYGYNWQVIAYKGEMKNPQVCGILNVTRLSDKEIKVDEIKKLGSPDEIKVGRFGKDFRGGQNVSVRDIKERFGLYDVIFGQPTEPKLQQELLNKLYDSFSDLADLLGVDPTALSLGGRVKITLNADLEPNVLGNMTRTATLGQVQNIRITTKDLDDTGSLGHEWLHSLDNYFGILNGYYFEFLSDNANVATLSNEKTKQKIEELAKRLTWANGVKVRPEVLAAFANLKRVIRETGLEDRSKAKDKGRSEKYWSENYEMFARSFSTYVSQKLQERGESNNHLGGTRYWEYYGHYHDKNAFQEVLPEDVKAITEAYDNLFKVLLTKETKGLNGKMVQTFYSASEERKLVRSFADVIEEVVKANPGASFSVNLDGDIIMEQKDGTKTKVNIVDNILLNDSQMQDAKESHGLKGNIIINGMWQKATEAGFNSVLTLSKRSERGTAFHEALHAAIDNALTAREKDALYSYYSKKAKELGMDVEEVIADAYRDWVLAKQDNKGSMFGKLWRKVKDFCSRMVSAFSKSAEVNRIFQDIESGKVRERGNRNENINKAKTDKNQNSKSEQDQVGKQNALKGEEEKVREVNYSVKDQTETPAFKEWFGDSKLVDKDGKPLVLYRGISEPYNVNKQGEVTWVSENKEQADSYRNNGAGSEVLEVYARVENPLYLGNSWTEHTLTSLVKNKLRPAVNKAVFEDKRISRAKGLELLDKLDQMIKNDSKNYVPLFEHYNENPDVLAVIKAAGYDAIQVDEGENTTYGVIGKSNVKSATDNNGDFSADNDDIHYSARKDDSQAPKIRKELTVSSDYDYGHKEKQFDIIQANNPMNDEYHTGIRSVNDIMSFEQAYERALNDSDGLFDEYPDWTEKMARDIMNTPDGKIKKVTIYSSKPIQSGAFVTPSRRMAEDYAGGGKIYSKTVPVDRVAWINSNEGQFAWAKESKVHYDNLSSVQKKAVDKYLSEGGDNDRLGRLLKSPSYRETPWARQTYRAILWKMAARELMAGREPNFHSALSNPENKRTHDLMLADGAKGAWNYVAETPDGFIGHPSKPLNAINASYTNCNPSIACAKFCYAAGGRNYDILLNKQEIVNFLIEEHPIESAQKVAEQYKATGQYINNENQKALRILDKGDISEKWLPFIEEINRQGIRLQIFSKRAELLNRIDADRNLVMLSIDSSNAGLADKYKNLPLAFVWSGPEDNARLEKERARFEKLGGVVLPVKIGKKVLDPQTIAKLPDWAQKYSCPIDSGVKKIGEHNCTKCDENGGMGCFFGKVTNEVMRRLALMDDLSNDKISAMIKRETARVAHEFELAGRKVNEKERQQLRKFLEAFYAGGMERDDSRTEARENGRNGSVSQGSRGTEEKERRNSREVLPRTSGEKVVTVDSGDVKYSARSIDDDLQAVREKYEGTKEWMKAPNGKKTKLTEKQWLQVRTPKFKAWFGDWENNPEKSSKVLDENGEPLAVYHGTPTAEFEQFSEGITYTTADQEVAQYYSEHNGDIVSRKDSYIDLNIDKKPLKDVLKFIEKHSGEKYQEYNPNVVDLVKNAFSKTEDDLADFFGDETDNSMKNREEWLDEHSEDTFEDWQQDLYDAVEEYHELAQKAVDGDISKSEAERMVELESQVKEIRKEQKTLAKRFLRGAEIGDILKKNPVLRSDEKMYVSQENDSVPFSESELREQAGELARQKSAKGLFPLFANIKNPFIYESKGKDWKRLSLVEYTNDEADDDVTTDYIAKWAKKQGYDGVIFKNVFDSDAHSADEFVTFKPNQLKSSTENNGNFSEDNDNIYYSARSVDDNESPEARGARAVSRTEKETIVERLRNAIKSAYTDWVDKLEPLNKLQAEIENALGYKLDYDKNVYKQARMAESTARGRAEMLVMGVDPEATVEAINKTLKNKKLQYNVTLRSVFDLIKDADMSEKHPDYLDNGGFENWQHAFSTYLTARRQVELQNQNPDYVGPMDEQDARDIVKNAPKELAEAAKKYYQYNDNMLTIAEDAGLISEEVHEALNDKYSDYAPMMRDFSDTAGVESFFGGLGGRGIGNVSSFLKKISKDGSSRNVIDPLEITVKNTYMVLDRAERNKVAQLFVDLSHENGIGEFIEPVDRDTSDPKNSIFTVMVDGKKQAFKTMPEFYGAIAGYNQQGAGAIGSLVRTAAQCLRTGATISPDFMFRNLIRDTIFAGISSKTGFRPLIDTIRGMQALRHNKELAEEFKAAGVPMSNFVGTNRRGAMETLNKLTGGDKKYHKLDPRRIISALYEMAQDYSELAEEGTRMGEFMRAREQGLSIEEAGFLAKEITLDFSRSGVYGQKYNQAVPFFNACIQGGDKFVRLMKHEPRATFMGVAKYIILPSLALWCMNHDEDWYKDLPEDVKNGSWCIKTGDTIWRIPKPQEAGVLFGSGMERFLDMVNGEDPKAMKNWAREYFFGTCMPNFIPTLVLPILEWVTNYSFFTGKEVVGTKYKRLPNEQQYSLYTTELAKRVGSITGTSPMKIDNTIKGYFGTAGSFVATSMDNIFGKEYESPEKRWSEYAGIRGITYQEGRRSQAVSDFYELVDEANKQHEGYGKKGKPAGYVVGLRQANKKISDLNKDIRNITVARNLTPEQKRARIDKIQIQIRNIARLAIARFKDKVNR